MTSSPTCRPGSRASSPWPSPAAPAASSPGEDGYIDLDLAPGTYLAMCFLADEATGKRHVELGMLAQLTVP